MLYFKSSKKIKELKNNSGSAALSFLSATLLLCLITSACVDLVPSYYRKGKELAKEQYYGYRADKWQEEEDSYLAAKAACCGPDKINDSVRSLELYCKAAQFGHKPSQVEIGRFYSFEAGAGKSSPIPLDRALAYAYFDLASQDGYTYADDMKNGLETKLTSDEKARAAQLVKDFPNIPCAITR